MYPLFFKPNLHEKVWGGHKLQPLKDLPGDSSRLGESWEISAVPGSESVIANGPLAGKTLGEAVRLHGAELMGRHIAQAYGEEFPMLLKFIDAQGDLSIQVHPDDTLARERHGKSGKTELWYVMDAEPGAFLYSGFSREISREEYVRRVEDGSIIDVLARHDVHPGDVFFIPSGRVHSICSGILLCEIQQSSDITYRLFDYLRPGLDGKPRELHTAEALDALDFRVYDDYRTHYAPVAEGYVRIADCRYFAVNLLATGHRLRRDLHAEDSFVALSCLYGSCRIHTADGHTLSLSRGHSCLLPPDETIYDIEATGENTNVKLLETYAKA